MALIGVNELGMSRQIGGASIGGGIPVVIPPAGINALNFDGVNDSVVNNVGTPFTEFERTQPFTYFANVDIPAYGMGNALSSTRASGATVGHSILINNAGLITVLLRGSAFLSVKSTGAVPLGKHTVGVTYDGSSLAAGVTMYIDGVATGKTVASDLLVDSILNGNNQMFAGIDVGFAAISFAGKMRWASYVNYVKLPADILADHVSGIQSVGTGSYLFAADFNRTTGLSFVSTDAAALTMDIIGQVAGDWVLF